MQVRAAVSAQKWHSCHHDGGKSTANADLLLQLILYSYIELSTLQSGSPA